MNFPVNKTDLQYNYFAFISYKREDRKWADWLHHKLEQYRLPSLLAKKHTGLPRRLKPVFRDTTDINPGVLEQVLQQNLEQSKYLIVICSPKSAQSKWVGKEITEFIAQKKQNNIILFIIDGVPYSDNPQTECYHPAIREQLPEMLGANIHEAGAGLPFIKKQRAFIQVVSKLLGLSFDTLWQRQKWRMVRDVLRGSAAGLLLIFTTAFTFYQYQTNKPFDVRIGLKEMSEHNPNLPFENGVITLCYDRDTLVSKKPISSYSDTAVFNNIPGKFFNKEACAAFRMTGFDSAAMQMILAKECVLPVKRNDRFGVIKGVIKDYDGNNLDSVKVTVDSQSVFTDKDGIFTVNITGKDQTVSKQVVVENKGYKTKTEKYLVGTNWKILMEKH